MSNYGSVKIQKNSLFLKITEGQSHTIRLLDAEPTEQFQHSTADKKMVSCIGETCFHCSDGLKKSQRFVCNVYSHNDKTVYLFSYGPTVANELKSIAQGLEKDGEDILNHDLEVSVTGSGLQKKTKVQLRMKSQPVPEGLKRHEIKSKKEEIEF